MLQRESGDVTEEFRLWKPSIVGGKEMYQPRKTSETHLLINIRFVHKITKTRCAIRPDEKGGGILADEMGMGKTLSILALVIKTIEDGYEWAKENRINEHSHSRVKHHTHSTLIIVPAGCKSCRNYNLDKHALTLPSAYKQLGEGD